MCPSFLGSSFSGTSCLQERAQQRLEKTDRRHASPAGRTGDRRGSRACAHGRSRAVKNVPQQCLADYGRASSSRSVPCLDLTKRIPTCAPRDIVDTSEVRHCGKQLLNSFWGVSYLFSASGMTFLQRFSSHFEIFNFESSKSVLSWTF